MSQVLQATLRKLKANPFADAWKVTQYESLASQIAPLLEGADVIIDLGCGEGLFSQQLQWKIKSLTLFVGMDIAEERSWSSRQSVVNYVVGDASRPPFRPGSATMVVAKDLLHHMDDPKVGVHWLNAMADERVVIVEANLDNPIMALYKKHNGDQHFSTAALIALLHDVAPEAHWKIDHVVAYPFYLPPVSGSTAIWVWPVTALMLAAFKGLRSRWLAAALDRLLWRLPWAPPFTVAVATKAAAS